MRIHRIRLRNYRGVAEREVAFEAEGVTVIEGDNEAGKSSIAEAIDLLLEERDDTTRARVKAVKPVHLDAGAEVEAEISAGDYRFVYAKRWHTKPETKLDIIEPRREQLTGRTAHDRVREILDETVDEALWRALRVQQGKVPLPEKFDADSSLARALDRASGGAIAGDRENDLFTRSRDERDRYWTKTGRPNAERKQTEAALEARARDIGECESALRDLEADVASHERLTKELNALRQRLPELERNRDEMQQSWHAVEQQKAEVATLAARRDEAAGVLDGANAAFDVRQKLISEAERRRAEVAVSEEEEERNRPAVDLALSAVKEAEEALRHERKLVEAATRSRESAAADHDHLRDVFDLDMLEERHGRVVDSENKIREADEVLDVLLVDDAALDAIEAAGTAVTRLNAALTAGAGTIRTEALREIEIRFGDETVRLTPGIPEERRLAGEMEIVVGDDVRMLVSAGADSRATASELDAALRDLDRLCGAARVADVVAARQAHRDRQRVEQERGGLVSRRSEDLRDLTADEMSAKIDRLRSKTTEFVQARPPEPPLPGTVSRAQELLDAAVVAEREGQKELARRQVALDHSKEGYQDALLAHGRISEQVTATKRESESADEQLAAARVAESDEILQAAVVTAEADSAAAANRHEEAELSLAKEGPDALQGRLENAKAAVERAAGEIRGIENDLASTQARLEVRGEEGLQHRLDEARTRHEALSRERDRTEARAAAALLLHATLTRHRDSAKQRYTAPFRERIESMARVVFGPDLEVELDDDLRIVRRTLDGKTLGWDDLSTGAKEQLAIIALLACAAIVSPDGGVPVIFDDTLGNTDPGRLERMGALLSIAGSSSQVVILTCMPNRYQTVGNAKVIRVTASGD